MKKFQPRFGSAVNLHDSKTYSHLPKTDRELDDMMLKQIGYALLYMDYFPSRKDMFPTKKLKKDKKWFYSGYKQRRRVLKLIKNFAENRQKKWGNVKWFQEQVFLIDDETENMC